MDSSKAVRYASNAAAVIGGGYLATHSMTRIGKAAGVGLIGATALRAAQARKHGGYAKAHAARQKAAAYNAGLGKPHGQHARGVATRRANRTRRNYKGQFAGSY
jgi:hypothetical protein